MKTFEHVASEIGAEEAEEVGVEHLLRDIKVSLCSGVFFLQVFFQVYFFSKKIWLEIGHFNICMINVIRFFVRPFVERSVSS